MSRVCGTQVQARDVQILHAFSRELLRDVTPNTDQLYVAIRYIVLYRNADENLSLPLLQSQHHFLNLCFNQGNATVAQVPSTGHYNFSAVIGNAGIKFLPSDHTQLAEETHVTRLAVNRTFAGVVEVAAFVQSQGILTPEGTLNVYTAALQNNVLGEGDVLGRDCVLHWETVGGELLRGHLPPFDVGCTAVHELGHCFGLSHTFNDNCLIVHEDIPAQRQPNYTFQLANGGSLCNRQRDCQIYRGHDDSFKLPGQDPPYSCWNCPASCPQCDTDVYEMGCNFMDYATDYNMALFSVTQAVAMRNALLSQMMGVVSQPSDETTEPSHPISSSAAPSTTSPSKVQSAGSKKNDNLITWLILGICGLLVLLFIGLVLFLSLRPKKENA